MSSLMADLIAIIVGRSGRDELEAMLIYSMSVSVDGFIADREGAFGWTVPSEEQFRFHLAQVRELGGYLCGRRLYETMLRVGDGSVAARHRARGRVRRRLVRDPEGRLQPHARQRSGQRPARRGVGGRGGRCGARRDRQGRLDRRRRPGRGSDRARPRRRAAHVPQSGRRRWRHAVPAAGHRRRSRST